MTVATGNFAELLWPGIRTIWGQSYNDYEPLYTKVFDVVSSNKAFEKEQGVTGLPAAAVTDQGSPYISREMYQGFQKEYVMVQYSIGAAVTKIMNDDDQYNYINSIPQMLARSMRHTEEVVAWDQFNNGFGSATAADGLSIFNSAHLHVTGATFSNMPAVASDLSQAALEQMFIDTMGFTDDQGLRIRVLPKTLIVSTTDRFTAQKILETEYEVGSADNTINPVKGMLDLVVSPYLTDTDAWFVKTDVLNGFRFFQREAASLDRDNEFTTRNLLFSSWMRFDVGVTDPKCAYGSAVA